MKCIGTAGHPLPKGEGGERSESGEGSFPFQRGRTPIQLTNPRSIIQGFNEPIEELLG
jgi:hypothetical protein